MCGLHKHMGLEVSLGSFTANKYKKDGSGNCVKIFAVYIILFTYTSP